MAGASLLFQGKGGRDYRREGRGGGRRLIGQRQKEGTWERERGREGGREGEREGREEGGTWALPAEVET